jgi:hypothetical protein
MFAVRELFHTLKAAWAASDLRRRLAAWWWVVTHRDLLDSPAPIHRAPEEGTGGLGD